MEPSGFRTGTIEEDQGECEDLITPVSNNNLISSLIWSFQAGAILYGGYLIGGASPV